MMNAQQCRKRAQQCLRLAETDANGADEWRQLSLSWSQLAEQRESQETQRGMVPPPPRNAAVDIADSLRVRLDLTLTQFADELASESQVEPKTLLPPSAD